MNTIELFTVFAFRRIIEQVRNYIQQQYSDATFSFRLADGYEDIFNQSNTVLSIHLLPLLLALIN